MHVRPVVRPNQKIDRVRLVELLHTRHTFKQCAAEFGCTYAAVINYINRHGLTCNRRGYRRFTVEQKKDICKMVGNGVPVSYVAKLYKHNYNTLTVLLCLWGVKSRWNVVGARTDGSYGPPVSNSEIVDNWNGVYSWLYRRYSYASVDILTDAVNRGAIELRRMPRPAVWFAIWCGIAARRCVDALRQGSADRRRARGRRVEYDDIIPANGSCGGQSAVDNIDEVEAAIAMLSKRLQKVVRAKLSNVSNPWVTLRLSQSRYYVLLAEAYERMRTSLDASSSRESCG